jgi:hypothetical protein
MEIRLTDAQQSAFECRDWSEEPATRAALTAGMCSSLVFLRRDGERLWREINDASNSEDAYAEIDRHDHDLRVMARRASRSLACVAGKCLDAHR